jgi:hypothetical protein
MSIQNQAFDNSLIAHNELIMPIGNNLNGVPSLVSSTKYPYKGALGYDQGTQQLFYGNGVQWLLPGAGNTGNTGSGPTGSTGQPGLATNTGSTGSIGLTGSTGFGITGSTGQPGLAASTGSTGTPGATGVAGTIGGSAGIAEYVELIQGSNNSVPPGSAFILSNQTINTIGITTVAGPAGQGTAFILPAGTYIIDYELSLGSAGSIALYLGAAVGSVAIDNNTIAGSTTATSWIHGRATEVIVTGTNDHIILSSVVGTAAVVTAGTAAGFFIVRMTFLKIA